MMNNTLQWMVYLGAAATLSGWVPRAVPAESGRPQEILFLVRGDDMGVSRTINEACIRSYRDGIVRSVEVMVPGAWFLDAARLLKENPGLDVGVHLTLTSEWDYCKWGPLTRAPSLVDANGYFRPMTRQRQDFMPDTGFVEANPKLEEVEAELRAQIEMARRHIPQVSHMTAHMGTPTATPELRTLTQRLAEEYGLPIVVEGLQRAGRWQGDTPAEREASLLAILQELKPGRWLLVEHPGLDTMEMRGMGHYGYRNVASHRTSVTAGFTSSKVKEAIQERGIQLVSYADLLQPETARTD